MLRAIQIVRKPAVRPERVADTVTLDHLRRGGSTVAAVTEAGAEIAIALERPAALNDGDALKLDDGRLVLVRAAAQKLLEVTAENPQRLLRAAWQLGGHHVPVEVAGEALYVEESAAVAELIRGLGCAFAPVSRAFQPEQDAHVHGEDCGCGHDHHHHDHGHDHHHHAHAHAHETHHAHAGHGHGHADAHAHAHSHGEGCGCGHDHDHKGHGY